MKYYKEFKHYRFVRQSHVYMYVRSQFHITDKIPENIKKIHTKPENISRIVFSFSWERLMQTSRSQKVIR